MREDTVGLSGYPENCTALRKMTTLPPGGLVYVSNNPCHTSVSAWLLCCRFFNSLPPTGCLELDFRIAFVVDIHYWNNSGDSRYGISVRFATRVCDELVQQGCWR